MGRGGRRSQDSGGATWGDQLDTLTFAFTFNVQFIFIAVCISLKVILTADDCYCLLFYCALCCASAYISIAVSISPPIIFPGRSDVSLPFLISTWQTSLLFSQLLIIRCRLSWLQCTAVNFHCIFTLFSLHFHFIFIPFPLHFHSILIAFSLYFHSIFTPVSLLSHCFFIAFSLHFQSIFTPFSLHFHCFSPAFSLHSPCFFTAFSLHFYCIFIPFSLLFHYIFTAFSLHFHSIFTAPTWHTSRLLKRPTA